MEEHIIKMYNNATWDLAADFAYKVKRSASRIDIALWQAGANCQVLCFCCCACSNVTHSSDRFLKLA